MTRTIDLTGKRFGKLLVIRVDKKSDLKHLKWICRCSCGKMASIRGSSLTSGSSKSCKCEWIKHGMSGSGVYKIYTSMIQRCSNKKHPSYHHYGGRGIRVCKRWKAGFKNFQEDMGKRPHGLELERIDNSKGYRPDNCKWANRKEQMRNTRGNRIITIDGTKMILTDWLKKRKMSSAAFYDRVSKGWSIRKALMTSVVLYHNKKYSHRGKHLTLRMWSLKTGIGVGTLQHRINIGWKLNDVFEKSVGPTSARSTNNRRRRA